MATTPASYDVRTTDGFCSMTATRRFFYFPNNAIFWFWTLTVRPLTNFVRYEPPIHEHFLLIFCSRLSSVCVKCVSYFL